ncbi:KpsF/GutQ family sugar-phosphate isomerase [Burkholderiaceae bacterium]|nr:KpsF/GutQ family sugar-phosphate isomerase [Burkholderiaceae bacterium]
MTLAKTPPSFDLSQTVTVAKAALDIEANALRQAADRLDGAFTAVVARILACTGRVVVMGMGKSGHVGNKIAATLASTGTPAFFVHPGEASHGDLGMITADDLVLAVSNSGESDELNAVLPVIKRMGIGLIALTGGADSSLARYADGVLNSAVDKEACPLNLAPTASTTVQMALGDALAIALLEARGFKPADFARSHPGGALGRKLLTHVHDIMRTEGQIPSVGPEATGLEVMREMSDKGLGATAIVNSQNQPVGIFTDGDLRRLLEGGGDLRAMTAATLMRNAPRVISMDALAAEAADVMEANAVTSLLVVDGDGRLVGALNANDLMRAKVI